MTVTFIPHPLTKKKLYKLKQTRSYNKRETTEYYTETAIKIQTTAENVLAAVITTERATLPLQRVNKVRKL